ncbi:ATPase [Flavimobilis sp. GY10621]|uniref:ATPase n=1 Tax=Flavimobilis rhizosphaerae TaxID=2775421 RepID=A0ABR9DND2_9MICO|nr:FGGY-family carbohydrate kinase [Flavimobilis rhizosphaerae]MBD9698631.1 ATPase [Flavimobilis rhizosphaerae]
MEQRSPLSDAARTLAEGRAVLGIELGSTRIKAVLVGPDLAPLAQGSHVWENKLVGATWTYSLEDVEAGVQDAVAAVLGDAEVRHGVRPRDLAGLGVSAMMHGYLALDAAGNALVPFRTWRNTSTGPAAALLTEALGVNIPLRWSVSHLVQAVLDDEPHLAHLARLTTLAGYVHGRLTGQHVLGVGDASGMFPIAAGFSADPTLGYDADRVATVDALLAERGHALRLADLLPTPLAAGADAGTLTAEGAAYLDPSGTLQPGAPVAPPEGDAGTGMVATAAVRPRTGNVSVGTSIFAMVVLEQPLARVHPEIDVVTTPAGDPVAMVHCNNGASELGAWAGVFGELASALGSQATADDVFGAFLRAALDGEPDAGGVYAYNQLSGEPVAHLDEGAPLVVRTPGSQLTLANLARAHVYGVFATLSLGLRALADEGVAIDALRAHGGIFRTAGIAQRFCAAAVGAPVSVGQSAGEGGAWGMAVLASLRHAVASGTSATDASGTPDLAAYLDEVVGGAATVVAPDPADVAGYTTYLARYEAGLESVRAAARTLTEPDATTTVAATAATSGRTDA